MDEALSRLIEALRNPACYPHAADTVEVIETHISVVLLAGEHAYKVKKPLDLGFLDYSTLEKRKRGCAEEVRRNAALAPGLYECMVGIHGTPEKPRLSTDIGGAFEVAVRMHRFPQHAQLDRRLAAGQLDVADMERIAACVAAYQTAARRIGIDEGFGIPDAVWRPIAENFDQVLPRLDDAGKIARIERLRVWSEIEHARCADSLLNARLAGGFVRACHGDLHLSNLAEIDERVVAFDCIEFDPNLYRIDVISDTAFLVMDLLARNRRDLAAVFLDRWLQRTGDFDALPLLRHYLVYRSMVRAKVAAIAMTQHEGEDRTPHRTRFQTHVELAERIAKEGVGALVIASGVAGSGKSTVTRALVPHLGALRVRSDRERKRLFGLGETESSHSPIDGGIYTPDAHARTYDRLEEATAASLASHHVTIVDGAFLRRQDRDRFRALADRLGAPVVVLRCTAPEDVLFRRVRERAARGDDASEAGPEVLARQLAGAEPAHDEPDVVTYDTRSELSSERVQKLSEEIRSRLETRIN